MKCQFNVFPRQSSKTVMLCNEVADITKHMKNKNIMVVSAKEIHSRCLRQYIKSKMNVFGMISTQNLIKDLNDNNIFFCNQYNLDVTIKGTSFHYFFIDEYLFFKEGIRANIYRTIKGVHPNCNVVIYTSPDKQYNKRDINIVKFMKENDYGDFSIFNECKRSELIELYNNFITDPNTSVLSYYDHMRERYPKENFEIEILGKLYKE